MALMGLLLFASCQDHDLPGSGAMKLAAPDLTTISGAATMKMMSSTSITSTNGVTLISANGL